MVNNLTFEFDNLGSNKSNKLEIREDGLTTCVFLICDDKEICLFQFDRDQWGLYISSNDFCICQEDGTRSFIEALINCLLKIKKENEVTYL